jgi:cytochrome P450
MMATLALDERLTVPGPPPMPIVGAIGNMFGFIADRIGHTRRLFETYGPVVALAAGGGTNLYSPRRDCPGTVFVYGPELVREATTHHDDYVKYPVSGKLYPTGDVSTRTEPLKHFGVGLFGVNGDQHRQHRRLMMPAFHRQRIDAYRDDMVTMTRSVLDDWRVGATVDVSAELRRLTLRIAAKTLFGEQPAAHPGRADGQETTGAGRTLQDVLAVLATPLTRLLPRDLPGLPYRRLLNLTARYDTEMRALIARRRQAPGDDGTVLSMLLGARDEESGAPLDEDELLGHVGVLFAAGHETSSSALTWTLFLLAQHPKFAADLLDELDAVLGDDAPTVKQLARLPLLERVVKESMRVIPPVPLTWRVTAAPTLLGGFPIPTGTEVSVSIYQTHHMPELYPEPERFDPRRWETIEPTVFEYTPFGSGARMCIGVTFAMMELRIILAMVLQRFRLDCLPRPRVDRSGLIVIAPKGGLPMIVRRRGDRSSESVGGVHGNVREMVELPA